MKVCFVITESRNLILNGHREQSGGAEKRLTTLGLELHKIGVEVSFIDFDYGIDFEDNIDGIKFYKSFKIGSGVPILRYWTHRIVSSITAIEASYAHVNIQAWS